MVKRKRQRNWKTCHEKTCSWENETIVRSAGWPIQKERIWDTSYQP